jgi:hypothetical protein
MKVFLCVIQKLSFKFYIRNCKLSFRYSFSNNFKVECPAVLFQKAPTPILYIYLTPIWKNKKERKKKGEEVNTRELGVFVTGQKIIIFNHIIL